MTEKREPNQYDSLMDTQRLLLGAEPLEDEDISLESILAEYGSGASAGGETSASPPSEDTVAAQAEEPEAADKAPLPENSPPPQPVENESSQPREGASRPERQGRRKFSKILRFPTPPEALKADEPLPEEPQEETPIPDLQPDADLDDILPEKLFGLESADSEPSKKTEAARGADGPSEAAPSQEEPEEDSGPTLTMEDVVASTVDAVKEEQERRQEKFRQRLEKKRRKNAPKQLKRREPSFRHPLPEVEQEPSLNSAAAQHKRRYYECRRSLLLSVPVLIPLWLPWLLGQAGVTVPFFSENTGNAAICVLIPQAAVCLLAWPVFRGALEGLREHSFTFYAAAALSDLVTLLDEMTLTSGGKDVEVTDNGDGTYTFTMPSGDVKIEAGRKERG